MTRSLKILVWVALGIAIIIPILAAALSPLLAWREPVYIAAGFAGIIAMALLLFQPLLIGKFLPGLSTAQCRQFHQWTGSLLVCLVLVHVAGLWITSPPDVVDALLFRSPTPFSAWGVTAMWAVFGAALLIGLRKSLKLKQRTWRTGHIILVGITVAGSVVHALLIEGTMETVSKVALCALVILATIKAILSSRIWKRDN